jgi:ABC-2 type transport system permease protein
MNKSYLIFKNELITTLTSRSFMIMLFLMPAASGIIMLLISFLGQNTSKFVSQVFSPAPKTAVEGFVDLGGIIKSIPVDESPKRLIAYPDTLLARQALTKGTITGYYVIPKDYITSGKVLYVRSDFNPLAGLDQTYAIQALIHYNLLGGNASLAAKLDAPSALERVSLQPSVPQREQNNPLTFILPYVVTMIFYIIIITAASLMLNSVTAEKQNKVIEILMVSVTPTQLLSGKIIALGLVGLIQTIVWMGAGYGLLIISGQKLNLGAAFFLPPSILFWGGIFFLLGYAVYAGLMAGVGALVPNLREASQATTIMIIPMIIPLALISTLVNSPNGAIAIILSLFPLTSPIAMMTRLAAGSVPLWQLILSVLILVFTALVTIRSVAGMFRAQTLLSGQAFNIKSFYLALAGKS